MRIEICSSDICTACGACENICPKGCVVREKDVSVFHMLKGDGCVDCGMCERVCPVQKPIELNQPKKAYAAKATDDALRKQSASGGIAATLYEYAVSQGIEFVGARLNEKFECHLCFGDSEQDIKSFRNSKYTYSYADSSYKRVGVLLMEGKQVLFIGLPCQNAALRKYLDIKKINSVGLTAVDLICHGTPMPDYLFQHIKAIETITGNKANRCYFRDAKFDTSNYAYTLYKRNSDLPFYKKGVYEDDLYQIGYHGALIYRDGCYQCPYAQLNRTGDLTIGDYHVFDVDSCDIDTVKMSLILVNTDKGVETLSKLEGKVSFIERPIEEPQKGEKQLRHPSVAGPQRELFLKEYAKTGNYEQAAAVAFAGVVKYNTSLMPKMIFSAKKAVKKLVPKKLWRMAKVIKSR